MDARSPDAFLKSGVELLPVQASPGARGGRRPIAHAVVLRVIWWVLTVGCRWKDIPRELGCCGETARMRLKQCQEIGMWQRVHHRLLVEIEAARSSQIGDNDCGFHLRAFGGGDHSGPSPVARRKSGTKYMVLVDAGAVPLALQSAGANVSDHCQILSTVIRSPLLGGTPGRPRKQPRILLADAGYNSDGTRALLRILGIKPRIRRRHTSHGSHLGRIRWVVERNLSWIKGLRRLRIRYDRHPTLVDAWHHLALAAICFRILHRSKQSAS